MTKASPATSATDPGSQTDAARTTGATETPKGSPSARPRVSTRRVVVVGILVSLFLAGVVSFYASTHPDGLAFVAGEKGFLHSAGAHASDGSPFAGYSTRGVENARLSRGLAGVVGATLVFVLAGGLFLVVRRRDQRDTAGDTAGGAAGGAAGDSPSDGDG
ncbi:PDGLE domain-containing protein [Pedococcus bigeumensis]|uniref:PDGLE domain-containing protein n=1 Tax=Pedococcus bigeumensis TaxID=433644 RepID=UPI0014777CCC|nr:PDGLE domain-containing protein [Pedococcus bigeumensis]